MMNGVRAGTALVLCILFVLFAPAEHASADDASYNTYSTGVKIIEYGAAGTPNSYCSNLKVDDGGEKNAFCIEPGVDFAGGMKRRIDASEVIPQSDLTDAALGVYYLSTVEPAEGLSRLGWQQYWIWVSLRRITAPNVTDIWVRNGPPEETQNAVLRDIRAYVSANRNRFTGRGYIYTDGGSQRVARFWVEGNGSVSLAKAPVGDEALVRECPELYSPAGAVYTVYNSASLAGDARVGTLTTDENGRTGTLDLPAGTYYVAETKAPYGYARDTAVMEKTLVQGEHWDIEAFDEPLFGSADILLRKSAVATGDGEAAEEVPPLAGAEFKVRYYPTLSAGYGEKDPARTWLFRTDESGTVRLSEEYRSGGDELFYDRKGRPVLLLGTYTFEECAAPEGYLVSKDVFARQVTADHSDLPETVLFESPVFEEYLVPTIKTEAFWYGGTKNHAHGASADIVDKVNCSRLLPGEEYVLKASLADPEDGRVLASGEKRFTAEDGGAYAEASVEVPVALSEADCAGLAGSPEGTGKKRLVVFEELFLIDGEKKVLMAEEKTADSPEQSVSLPSMGTAASLSGVDESTGRAFLTDVISYSGLCSGVEVTFETTLINKDDGEAITGPDGQPVKVLTKLTPDEPDGTLEINVEIPAEEIRGRSVVFFERVYEGGIEIMRHMDRENDKQTVKIPETPGIPDKPPVPDVPDTPDTGDDQSVKSYVALFGTSSFFLMCAAMAKRIRAASHPLRKNR